MTVLTQSIKYLNRINYKNKKYDCTKTVCEGNQVDFLRQNGCDDPVMR